jgi:PAS domain S-box-containing protein
VSRRGFVVAIAVLAVEVAAAVWLVLASHHEKAKTLTLMLELPAGVSFVLAGLIAVRRRPENRTGFYLAAVGYLWLLGALTEANNHLVYSIGAILSNSTYVALAALVLAFPTGRLARRPDQLLVKLTLALVLVGPPLLLLFADKPPSCSSGCGQSAFVIYRSKTIENVLELVGSLLTVGLTAVIVAVLVRRWRRASAALRRVLRPVYLASGATLVFLLLGNLASTFSPHVSNLLGPIFLVAFTTIPITFLYGILRSRFAQRSVADLAVAVAQHEPLRDAIASALGDPSLELAYAVDDGRMYVDRDGRRFNLPGPRTGRSATLVGREGRVVGALVHDSSLDDQTELLRSVAATVGLALDNERLEADLRSQYDFLLAVVDTAPSLLVSLDTEGRIRNLNAAAAATSGYASDEEVRDRFFWDVYIDESEREAMVGRFRAAAPDFPPSAYENVFVDAQGAQRVIAWRSAPVLDEGGTVVRIVCGGLDVTERMRQEEELRASRARIVAAGDEARRRLERNLHDGAQQRLVSLSISLRLAQAKADGDPTETKRLLEQASDDLAQALDELRELARGIHPVVLTDRGLAAALETLVARAPVPVELHTPEERLPGPIEAAAYYVIAEAVTNAVKHATPSAINVSVTAPNGHVLVEISDDGVGGADPAAGTGLSGLADRVAALDGILRVESAAGGTRVLADIPIGPG